MSDVVELHRRGLDTTRPVVAGIASSQWTVPTPCAGWDVRSLVNHVVSGNLWAAQLAGGLTIEDVGDSLDGDVLGENPIEAYDASARAAASVFAAPGALESPCAVSYGPVPGAVYAGHRFIDVFIHGWDLAKATGQDATLDPELVNACWEVVQPQVSLLRGSGMFGSDIKAPVDADPQTRLLAVLGRS